MDAKAFCEDFLGIWSRNTMHTIKAHLEVFSVDKSANLVKIKQLLHQVDIIIWIIDNIDSNYFTIDELLLALTDFIDVYWFIINKCFVWLHFFGFLKHRVGHCFRSWTTIGSVKFDSEILSWSSWVVTGWEDYTTHAVLINSSNEIRNSRSG